MATRKPEPVGVLVLRVWLDGDPPAFRARLLSTLDLQGGQDDVAVTADPEDVLERVSAFLAEFLARG